MSKKGNGFEDESRSSRLLKIAAVAATGIGIAVWGASNLFGSAASETDEREQDRTIWQPPPSGWVKVNCDGSFRKDIVAAGGLLRDEHGKWLGGFLIKKYSDSGSSSEAEYLGLLKGLELAWNLGYRKVIAETDLESAIFLSSGDQKKLGVHKEQIQHIRNLREKPWELKLERISRAANTVANRLAYLAVNCSQQEVEELKYHQQEEVEELKDPPPEIKFHLARDSERASESSKISCFNQSSKYSLQ